MAGTGAAERREVISRLQALKNACKDLQSCNNPISILRRPAKDPKSAIDALLALAAEADAVLSSDPDLSTVTTSSLPKLKELLGDLQRAQQGFGPRSLVCRATTKNKISQIGREIEARLQSRIDRESVVDLVRVLTGTTGQNEKVEALARFDNRLAQGFDGDYQELILRAKVFAAIESTLYDTSQTRLFNRLSDQAARAVLSLVKFNRTVFMGMVLMGPTVPCLIAIGSFCTVHVLYSLIRCAKAPLIDELHRNREIPRIMDLLNSEDPSVAEAALLCIFEIAFYGGREVIEAMLGQGLVQRLLELQGSKRSARIGNEGKAVVEEFAFEDCVWRFAVQVEVGEGLDKKDKPALKLAILELVRSAASSSSTSTNDCQIDILWGSSS